MYELSESELGNTHLTLGSAGQAGMHLPAVRGILCSGWLPTPESEVSQAEPRWHTPRGHPCLFSGVHASPALGLHLCLEICVLKPTCDLREVEYSLPFYGLLSTWAIGVHTAWGCKRSWRKGRHSAWLERKGVGAERIVQSCSPRSRQVGRNSLSGKCGSQVALEPLCPLL